MSADPWRDPYAVHPCTHPDHVGVGTHYHEVEPGRWRLFTPTPTTAWVSEIDQPRRPLQGEPMSITIYGASDDLVEIEGAIREEYPLGKPHSRLRLTAPDGDSLDVVLWFNGEIGQLDWSIGVEAVDAYPPWPIRFHERPGYEGDPAVTIDAPECTRVEAL